MRRPAPDFLPNVQALIDASLATLGVYEDAEPVVKFGGTSCALHASSLGRYAQIGSKVSGWMLATLDAAPAVGQLSVPVPVTPRTPAAAGTSTIVCSTGYVVGVSQAPASVPMRITAGAFQTALAGGVEIGLLLDEGDAIPSTLNVTNAVPFALASGDVLAVQYEYEAA